MIVKKVHRSGQKIKIDLTGPDGNAFVILGIAQQLCKSTGKDWEAIHKWMTYSDYENLLQVFEHEFGDFVIMYR